MRVREWMHACGFVVCMSMICDETRGKCMWMKGKMDIIGVHAPPPKNSQPETWDSGRGKKYLPGLPAR